MMKIQGCNKIIIIQWIEKNEGKKKDSKNEENMDKFVDRRARKIILMKLDKEEDPYRVRDYEKMVL